ncbi:hypothetical protein M3610_09200 [Neobacillus sp. MER 74]|uniref:hypothetical protein n=1 Tax=Neobacillus sp. MER 74 TaxID=2939566 RepID=UPI00203ED69F|nr:hypothetical protein [Neobacillus sp. MER 74]MCM3115463.1 hypothetical protein [Neobacillus sp. MER 74]
MKETSNKGFIIVYDRKMFLDLLTHGIIPLSKHEGTYTEYLYEFNESTFELIDKIYEQNYAEGYI